MEGNNCTICKECDRLLGIKSQAQGILMIENHFIFGESLDHLKDNIKALHIPLRKNAHRLPQKCENICDACDKDIKVPLLFGKDKAKEDKAWAKRVRARYLQLINDIESSKPLREKKETPEQIERDINEIRLAVLRDDGTVNKEEMKRLEMVILQERLDRLREGMDPGETIDEDEVSMSIAQVAANYVQMICDGTFTKFDLYNDFGLSVQLKALIMAKVVQKCGKINPYTGKNW